MPLDFVHQLLVQPVLWPMVLLVHDSLIPNGVAFDGQGQNLEAARMLVQILHQGRVVFKDVPDVMIDVRR